MCWNHLAAKTDGRKPSCDLMITCAVLCSFFPVPFAYHSQLTCSWTLATQQSWETLGWLPWTAYSEVGCVLCLIDALVAEPMAVILSCFNTWASLAWSSSNQAASHPSAGLHYCSCSSISSCTEYNETFLQHMHVCMACADGRYAWGTTAQGPPSSPAAGDEAIGTWQYMAPEYKLQGRSSMRTDAYAFGLTLLQVQ